MTDTRVDLLGRELRTAAPHALLSTLEAGLHTHFAAKYTAMLMADYGLAVLQPVLKLPHTGDPLPLSGSPAGHAFTSQQPHIDVVDGLVDVYLPVSVRGDRLGVLALTLTAHPTDELLSELAALATILAHELVVAERDTDVYLQARRRKRLTLAAEMQWQLLPGRACTRPEYSIGAQLEPAYAIGADNFDWSSDGHQLTITVSNGMGEGMQGALLTNLAVNALRNARRAGVDLADQASLADQAIWAQHRGTLHVATLLLRLDLATGTAAAIDAGSPRMLRLRDNRIEPVTLDAQLPLGMFDRTHYTEQPFHIQPGDRLVIVSDGVHAARSAAGEEYGSRALLDAITASQHTSPPEASRAILQQLLSYTQLTDDAVVLCLDWHGRPTDHPAHR